MFGKLAFNSVSSSVSFKIVISGYLEESSRLLEAKSSKEQRAYQCWRVQGGGLTNLTH